MIKNHNSSLTILQSHPLLRGVKLEYLQEMLVEGSVELYDDDNPIIALEGERAEKLYMILEGRVEVFKRDEESQELFTIRTFKPGDFLGESALFSTQTRTASLKAIGPTRLLTFSRDTLIHSHTRPWFSVFALNLAEELLDKLDNTSVITVTALKKQLEEVKLRERINRFLLYVISFLSIYTILVAFIQKISTTSFQIRVIANALPLIGVLVLIKFMRSNNYSLRFLGIIKPKNWGKDLAEALLSAVGLVSVITLLKYLVINTIPSWGQFPLFYHPLANLSNDLLIIVVYVLVVPIQEVLARGVLHSSFNLFFYDQRVTTRHIYAIVLSNAIFSASHAHLSGGFALLTFFPGCIWGILYARQGSLFGVIVNHTIVGVWAIHVLGFPIMLGTLGL